MKTEPLEGKETGKQNANERANPHHVPNYFRQPGGHAVQTLAANVASVGSAKIE